MVRRGKINPLPLTPGRYVRHEDGEARCERKYETPHGFCAVARERELIGPVAPRIGLNGRFVAKQLGQPLRPLNWNLGLGRNWRLCRTVSQKPHARKSHLKPDGREVVDAV